MSDSAGTSLEEWLSWLPPETPFHLPDEVLSGIFPPGIAEGVLDDGSRAAAEVFAAKFGCQFQYDAKTRGWCFVRPATRQ
jgi:hypothetical protein